MVDGLNLCSQVPSAQSPFSRRENGRKGSKDIWWLADPLPTQSVSWRQLKSPCRQSRSWSQSGEPSMWIPKWGHMAPGEHRHGLAWSVLWSLLGTQSLWRSHLSPLALILLFHLSLHSLPLCHYLLVLFPPPPLLFVVMGFLKKICLLAYLFLIIPVIYKYILVIKYSNKTEVCKVKNKLFPLPPILFSSLEVITIISLVYIFLEISLWMYMHLSVYSWIDSFILWVSFYINEVILFELSTTFLCVRFFPPHLTHYFRDPSKAMPTWRTVLVSLPAA